MTALMPTQTATRDVAARKTRRFMLLKQLTVFLGPPAFPLPARPLVLGLISMRPDHRWAEWPLKTSVAWVTDQLEVGGGEFLIRPPSGWPADGAHAMPPELADPCGSCPVVHAIDAALTLEQLFAGMTVGGDVGLHDAWADALARASTVERTWRLMPAMTCPTGDRLSPTVPSLVDWRAYAPADAPDLAGLAEVARRYVEAAEVADRPQPASALAACA